MKIIVYFLISLLISVTCFGIPYENTAYAQSDKKKSHDTKSDSKSKFTCGNKTKCGQMTSCEEARFYLEKCGVKRLDRDKDGIPCESLCGN